ncbi:Autoinducer 2 sensor kinase/phosphatase LuxQ [Pirellulimonas nuda]|uniref:histidine kinase n=1 Tax=Pirellulimonas nuda TaxID=2528009 RepID=A0A518D5I6_9BACT|nr:chemotaxis protein CheB [Pirellulimonas nuda]QDU86728.1 Autoinducer 2 sensor kinase/phosphatase LuxQ [Pirellulimonas nuda]
MQATPQPRSDDLAAAAAVASPRTEPEPADPACFHVVAIGASAGGLESLEKFFRDMPLDSGMAFVVLQHLSPDFRSLMDELLARQTKIRICKAEDDMAVEPNTIYLNPPRKNMIVSGGNLYLSDLDPNESLALPIDQFFRSLASDYRRQAIAVVLSGTGSDGSRGVRDVYEAGGLVLAETEETAKFDGMPRSAQETGCVHLALPPDAMPEALVSYVNQSLSPQDFADQVFVPPRLGGMERIFRLIRDAYGIDFSFYKPNTVVRRVERRVSLMHSGSIDAYVRQVESDPEELNALYRDLLIGVTRFFRDRDAFDYLKEEVFPELIQGKASGEELRVWVAGCASGEEAYSIAILVEEAMRDAGKSLEVKLFATDIHPTSLEVAAAGVYPSESFTQVSTERLERYFQPVSGGRFQVRTALRQMVVFAKHNVFKDAPFTKLDLISCRNLLIYLQPLAQKKALSLFHFGLRPRGILVLGPSESPGDLKDELESCNNRWKVFRKRRDVRLPAEVRLTPLAPREAAPQRTLVPPPPPPPPHRSLLRAYDALLARIASAAYLIDDARNVLHVFGDGQQHLQPRGGRLSLDLLEMVQEDLRPVLGAAIQRVRGGAEPVATTAVKLDSDQGERELSVRVERLHDPTVGQTWMLVTLAGREAPAERGAPADAVPASDFSSARVDDLEVELRYARENLQNTVEELETSNEELQATNEELVASNEELQSTNEELHSVNEELYTVNGEYQNKIAELTELTHDMENLLESTEIGTIFLDRDLAIRKYTGKVAAWFDLVSRDVGRKISAFSNNLGYAGLIEDLGRVLESGQPLEREVRDQSGKWLLLRLHPYRGEGAPAGVVMTLIDISNLKRMEREAARLALVARHTDNAVVITDPAGLTEWVNEGFTRITGFDLQDVLGKKPGEVLQGPESSTDTIRVMRERIQEKKGFNVEIVNYSKHGRSYWLAIEARPMFDDSGEMTGFMAIERDVTDLKRAQARAQEEVARRDEFLAMLSHELRNPLGAIKNGLEVLERSGELDDRKEIEGVLTAQVAQMTRLLDDLLDVSRIRQNKVLIQKRPIDLKRTAEDAIAAVMPLAESRGCPLRVQLSEEPVVVLGDAARLQQVQVNLLTNAIRHSAPGDPVDLLLEMHGDCAVITVQDQGEGISPELQSKVFDLFFQARPGIARSEGGLGVGLSLVRDFVAKHAGTVAVYSEGVGEGTRFVVTLPVHHGVADRAEQHKPIAAQPLRIVIVEDQEANRRMLRRVLELDGHQVWEADSASQGIDAIQEHRPDLALVDIGLPDMPGYEIARRLRRDDHHASLLVALTGYGQASDVETALEAGFDAHLAKPLDLNHLARCLATAHVGRGVAEPTGSE